MTKTLQDRLRAVEGDAPGEGGTRWYRNPDGPEAADALDAAEAREKRLREALEFARPLVEKWCHYQGNHPDLFTEYLGPIDAALRGEGVGTG